MLLWCTELNFLIIERVDQERILLWQKRKAVVVKSKLVIVFALFFRRKLVDLVWKDKEKLVVLYIELLEVDTMMGLAVQHKEQKVVRCAVDVRVGIGDFGGKMAKGR